MKDLIKAVPGRFTNCIIGIFLLASFVSSAQDAQVVDEIVAVVGAKIIMKSDVEMQYTQYLASGNPANEGLKCKIVEQLMMSKLLLNQAILDSLEVTDEQVESELDRKINYFISEIGSKEKLEAYYKKTIIEIKAEYRDLLKDQLLIQSMQQKVTKEIAVTPSDVRNYYERIPADSLPTLNAEMQVAQITKKAPENKDEMRNVKKQLEDIRQRILKGEDFATLAVLYSKDPSSKKGGELGFVNRGDLVPEFEAVAFSLKPGEVSNIVQTQFGFHIIQLIERRGNQINVRHILLKPSVSPEDLANVKLSLDTAYSLLSQNKINFGEAVQKFSDDQDTKNNGGLMVNAQSGSSKFEADQMDPALAYLISKMKPGDISEPQLYTTPDGKQGYRIIQLRSRTEAHKANLKDDYQKIQAVALADKQNNALKEWVGKKRNITFIQINEQYKNCTELKDWLKKQ